MTIYAVNGKEPIHAWIASLDTAGNGTTTLTDLIGGSNGTLTSMDAATDWIADTDAGGVRALDYDGNNDRVIASGYAASPGTGDRSWSFWFFTRTPNPPLSINAPDYISNRVLGAQGTQAGFALGNSGIATNVFNVLIDKGSGPYRQQRYDGFYPLTTWTHVLVVWNNAAGTITVYKNGSVVSASSVTSSGIVAGQSIGSTGSLHLGGRPGTTERIIDGRMDDIREFDQVLDATDATYLYASGTGRGIVAAATGNPNTQQHNHRTMRHAL